MTLASSWIGSVPTWLVLLAAAVAGWQLVRGKSGEAVAILQTSNEVLADRVHELEVETKEQATIIAELQAKTDFASQILPLLEAIQQHEKNADKRFERLLDVLDLVGKRLGSDRDA